MKYEDPKIQITELQELDIITLSAEQSGDGGIIDSDDGGWS